jgi:hypothetical protein
MSQAPACDAVRREIRTPVTRETSVPIFRVSSETDEYTATLSRVASESSGGALSGPTSQPIVIVTDLAFGPLRAATLEVIRADGNGTPAPNLLGMARRWAVTP